MAYVAIILLFVHLRKFLNVFLKWLRRFSKTTSLGCVVVSLQSFLWWLCSDLLLLHWLSFQVILVPLSNQSSSILASLHSEIKMGLNNSLWLALVLLILMLASDFLVTLDAFIELLRLVLGKGNDMLGLNDSFLHLSQFLVDNLQSLIDLARDLIVVSE